MAALTFPPSPGLNETFPSPPRADLPLWTWNGSRWMAVLIENPLNAFLQLAFAFSGRPVASARITVPVVIPFVIAANLSGSHATATTPGTVAAASFTVDKLVGTTPTQIGTISFAAGSAFATFSGAGAEFDAGDTLQIIAPATQNAALADIGINIMVRRL